MGRSRRYKKPTACIHSTSAVSDVPINQLRCVNKQLREEVAGLEIQYNTVHFERIPRQKMGHPIVNFLRFCASISESRLGWLTHVVIDGFWYRESPAPTYNNFVDWTCNPHAARQIDCLLRQALVLPELRIDLRVPTFELAEDLPGFVWTGLMLSHIMRGTEILAMGGRNASIDTMIGAVDDYLHKDDVKGIRARVEATTQVRFLPHNIAPGEERLEMLLRVTPADGPRTQLTTTSRAMLLHARGWFSEGI